MLQLTTILFLVAFSLLAAVHVLSLKLFLYWHFFWFDIPMHMFGGAVVALGFFTLRDLGIYQNKWLTAPRVLLLVFLIAISWEIFEITAGIPIEADYLLDAGSDLLVGLIGGYIGYILGVRLRSLR